MNTALTAPADKTSIIKAFEVTKAQIAEAVELANEATVDGPDDTEGMKLAHDYRMGLVKMRTTVEKRHKELKKGVLERGRLIDSVKKELIEPLPDAEARLKELEETAKREQERLAEIAKQERAKEMNRRNSLLYAIGEVIPEMELQFLDADEFETLYAERKDAYDAKKKAEAEADAARKAEEERLATQAEEQSRRQAEIKAKEAEIKAKQAEQQAEIDRQQAEIEAQKRAIEEAKRREQQAKDDAIRKEQEAKELAERVAREAKEQAEKIEAERLAEIEHKEAEDKAAAEEAARIAAAAPDAEKLRKHAKSMSDLPDISNVDARQRMRVAAQEYIHQLDSIADALEAGTL